MMDNHNPHLTREQQEAHHFLPLPDFDELAQLARQNPEQFEALRMELCEQLIARAPIHARRRLQGLQFQINMERRKSGAGMAACIRLSEMMNESLSKLNAALTLPAAQLEPSSQEPADVIPMFNSARN